MIIRCATKGTALASSEHSRSTLGKTRTSRLGFASVCCALALGASLVLTSCGNQAADAAAIVDDTVISDKDVQNVANELNALAEGGQKLSSSNVLLSLILEPYVSAEAIRAGKSVTDAEVLKVIEKVDEPSLPTVNFVRMQLALQNLTPASKTAIVTELAKAKITINPRYGSFDPKQVAIVPISQNWIKPGPTPQAK